MQSNTVAVLDRQPARRDVVRESECRCGQSLDMRHGAYCPRCGANLPHS